MPERGGFSLERNARASRIMSVISPFCSFFARMTSSSVEHLIQEHAPLVRRLALRLASRLPSNVDVDDLIQAGMLGLLDAARRYKAQVGAKFTSYASTRINGAMIDELRNQDWLPRSTRAAAKKLEDAVRQTTQTLGRQPEEKELAEFLGISDEDYSKLLDSAHGIQIVHYDQYASTDFVDAKDVNVNDPSGSFSIEDVASEYGDPATNVSAADFKRTLVRIIGELPEKERLVLSLYYEKDLNYKEIGEVIQLSQGRVCQLRTQAVTRLRALMLEEGWHSLPEELEGYL